MKKLFSAKFLPISICAIACFIAAPGGRGGGGRAPGGGGYRPSPGGGRAPGGSAVQRPAPRPAPGNRPSTMPAPSRPGPGNSGGVSLPGNGPGPIRPSPNPGNPSRPGGRPNAGDIAGSIGRTPPGHLPGTPGNRPGYPYYHKSEMTQNIYRRFPYSPAYGYPFSRNWCNQIHWHYRNWPYWAAAATGAALTRWINYPAYGGYGSSQELVYHPVESAPADVYEQNVPAVSEVAQQGQNAPVADDAQLLNIGAFALIPFGQKDLGFGLQLASANDGSLRGIQWDFAKNTTAEVQGSIEKDTLRVVWQSKGQPDSPFFETTVDQLTQQESLINVYDPKTKTLVSWQLIQIDEKDLPPQPAK
jgi:hypothetical protein